MKNKEIENIENLLKYTYEQAEPPESWGVLRERIERQLVNSIPPKGAARSCKTVFDLYFWKRLALIMAACFVITAGILAYFVIHNSVPEVATVDGGKEQFLTQADIDYLHTTFRQVQELFGQQSTWVIVGRGVSPQIGVENTPAFASPPEKLVVMRLSVGLNNGGEARREYLDLVAVPNQTTRFQLPLVEARGLHVSLTPIAEEDGRITVRMKVADDNQPGISKTTTLTNDPFTPLVRMQSNGKRLDISGAGKVISNI